MKDKSIKSSEWNVIRRCAEGDSDSFKELYDMYKDRVFTTSVRMLGNLQDAEDTLQDTFIKIFKNINKFKWKSSFATWVYKITVNTCIEHLRKRKKDGKIVDMDVYSDDITDLSDKKSAGDFRMIVENEISKLPEGYKTVFILHAIEGFKHSDIADILGISPGTSKSQFFRAKSQLRKNLLPYLEVLRNEL